MSQLRLPIILSTGFLVIGAYLRLSGLGIWDIAIDEYYFMQSILSVADNGLPNFPNGGYYIRGILIQYLIAPLTIFIDNTEYAIRIIPAITNILSIPAVYLISKKLGGDRAAALATFLFCFSLWEIEFARFARMYAPFQFIFIWQIYYLIKHLQDNRGHDLKIVLFLAFISAFVYAGSIFMVFVVIFGLILKAPNKQFQYWSLTLLTLSIVIALHKIDFRQASSLPVDLNGITEPASSLPIYLPNILLLNSTISILSLVFLVLAAIFTFMIILRNVSFFIGAYQRKVNSVIFLTFIISLFINQLLLATLLLLVVLILESTCVDRRQFNYKILTSIGLLFVWYIAWLSIGIIDLDLAYSNLFDHFLDFPKIKSAFVWHWFKSMPIHSTAIFLLLSLHYLILVSKNTKNDLCLVRIGYALLILLIVLTCTLNTKYNTTRYTFYLYPLFLILASCAILTISSFISKKTIKNIAYIALSSIFVITSEPFDFEHLTNINSAKYNYRLPYDQYRADLYFIRLDFRSVASFINENAQANDKIITFLPGVDTYLIHEVDYTFINEGQKNVLSCNATCYIWNGTPVIVNQDELINKIGTAKNNLWVISGLSRFFPLGKTQKYLNEVYENSIQYKNYDKSIAVYKF